jgi:hypothetical protein
VKKKVQSMYSRSVGSEGATSLVPVNDGVGMSSGVHRIGVRRSIARL